MIAIQQKFTYLDHLWQAGWCSPFLKVIFCGKKSENAKVFHHLYHKLKKELSVFDSIKERKKINALIVSMFE